MTRIPEVPPLATPGPDAIKLQASLTQVLGEHAREINRTLPADQAQAFSMFWGIVEVGAGVPKLIQDRGDILIGDSSGDENALPLGAADTFLGSDGTDPAWAAVATQAEQETGTATDALVTSGRQHFHLSAAKVWLNFTISSGTVSNETPSYNVDATTDNAAGDYTVNFTTDFSDADFAFSVMAYEDTGLPLIAAAYGSPTAIARAIGSIRFATRRSDTTAILEAADVSFIAFGDQ